MSEETRYITLSGGPPNGGFPPCQSFASVVGLPPVIQPEYYGPPPAYSLPLQPGFPVWYSGPPPPAPAAAPAAPAAPPLHFARYEPPGQYVDVSGDVRTLTMPNDLATIKFVRDFRPCDYPGGCPWEIPYETYKVPSVMTLEDFMIQIEAPAGDGIGITEMEELGDNKFSAGITIERGSDMATRTLAEIGWTQRKSEITPIWVTAKW